MTSDFSFSTHFPSLGQVSFDLNGVLRRLLKPQTKLIICSSIVKFKKKRGQEKEKLHFQITSRAEKGNC